MMPMPGSELSPLGKLDGYWWDKKNKDLMARFGTLDVSVIPFVLPAGPRKPDVGTAAAAHVEKKFQKPIVLSGSTGIPYVSP